MPDDAVRLTMWDWSWVSHHVPGAAFADWPTVLAEATERGFDTIRFDPLPDLVPLDRNDEPTVLVPAHPAPVGWVDVPGEQRLDPVEAVVEFADAARSAGLRLILSSWGINRGRSGGAVDFGTYPVWNPLADDAAVAERFLRGWDIVLTALASHGLLSQVRYVDVNNELDLVAALSSSRVRALGPVRDPFAWSTEHGRAFRDLAETCLRRLHERWPQLPATVSCCGPVDVVAPWYPRNADVLEWHVWCSEPDRRIWSERVGALFGDRPPEAADFDSVDKRKRIDALYRTAYDATAPALRRQQDGYLARVKQVADERGLPAYLGEGYATPWWSGLPEMSWDWVKDVSAGAVRTARRLGYDGYTTSNFSEPTFPLWQDVAWHHDVLT